jgi:hypothetical protein
MSRYPVAFRPPAFASWSSFARWGTWAFLVVGLPAPDTRCRTPTGLSRSTRTSNDRRGRPLNPGDSGSPTTGM